MSILLTAAKPYAMALRRFARSREGAMAFVAFLMMLPHPVSAACTTGTNQFSTGFTTLDNALDAAVDFFYGPFFKFGMIIAFVVCGVVQVLDDGNMNRAVQLILRVIMIVAAILGVVSWVGSPSAC